MLSNFLFILNKANFYSLKSYLKLGKRHEKDNSACFMLQACEELIDKSV